MKGLTYADTGVYIDLKREASEIMFKASKKTWKNRKGRFGEVITPFEHFSGFRGTEIGGLPYNSILSLSLEGEGTKPEVIERYGKYDTAAYDLVAMLCDDDVRNGGESTTVGSNLGINRLGEGVGRKRKNYLKYIHQLADGMVDAAKEARVAVINGEIEEMGRIIQGYGDFNYTWGGASVSFVRRDRIITGSKIKVGDSLVGLREEGFRANGTSLARRALSDEYGNEWHKAEFEGKTTVDFFYRPSKIYSPAVVDMTGGFEGEPKVEVHGIAHITGGGLPEKIGRLLKPKNLGANIDDTFEPCNLMLHCQEIGKISDRESYNTFHMGQGMVIATPEPEGAISLANYHGIEAKVIGKVVEEPIIKIVSKGFWKPGTILKSKV